MVFADINDSQYYFEYNNLLLYFSSKLYLDKFEQNYKRFLKEESIRFQLRYKCNVNCDEMILLLLYKKIEKRGFRVLYSGRKVKENYYISAIVHPLSFEG